MKKVRYCTTYLQRLWNCPSGWVYMSTDGTNCCVDEPMEMNCRNIVEKDNPLFPICPTVVMGEQAVG